MLPEELERPEMQIARALVAVRREKRITQQQLAERTGIAQADISRLENGNSNPSLRTLQRLADGLGMKISVGFQEIEDTDNSEDDASSSKAEDSAASESPSHEQPLLQIEKTARI